MTQPLTPGSAPDPVEDERELRQRAVKRLQDKRGLMAHVIAYVTVNALLIVIWWSTGATFFWPVFILLGWGIGLAFNAWDVLSPPAGERQIRAEMERLRGAGR